MTKTNSEKTKVVIELYSEHKNLQRVGDIVGLSRERVRQILNRENIDTKRVLKVIVCPECGNGKRFFEMSAFNGICIDCQKKRRQVWSQKYKTNCCSECGGSEKPHKSMGLCTTCFNRQQGRKNRAKKKLIKLNTTHYEKC